METMKKCKYCGGEADVSMGDDGYYYAGCDRDYDCENNIYFSNEKFATEHEAIEWWNGRQ